MNLSNLDLIVLFTYAFVLLVVAISLSKEEASHKKNTTDYFLASKSLPWWAIGASLIASNISAEQIIGMSGSGYALGIAIASYEWMAAITLLIVGKYLLPIFLEKKIMTMPQFLEIRFNSSVKTTLALFWLAVYVFVNLTAILWLGGLAVETVTGLDWFTGMLLLAGFSVAYSMYGGLKAVAYTDIIQVVLLIFGGLMLSYLALNQVSDGNGVIAGFITLTEKLPGHFDMILSSDNPHYMSLPGISVLVGGLWIMNLSYWGFNQYIIQRALAAKSLPEAQKGIAFAAYLKLLMPIIIVLPGIAAVLINPELSSPDKAYPSVMALMPSGLKGLIFAALVAAIVSSLASMTNSISTIFVMDIYKDYAKNKSEQHYVRMGRITTFSALAIAILVAEPLLGKFDQAFQYIQEFTGFFTPGIVVIFLMGMFYKQTTSQGALSAAIGSAVFSLVLKVGIPSLPFMDRVMIVFGMCLALCWIVSKLTEQKLQPTSLVVEGNRISYNTSAGYNVASLGVFLVLATLYVTWW